MEMMLATTVDSRLMRNDACKRAGVVFKPKRQQQKAVIVAGSKYSSYQQKQVVKNGCSSISLCKTYQNNLVRGSAS